MRLYVGLTDYDWYRFLASRDGLDEVNFWQPSGQFQFKALSPGEPFLFKLHSPRNFIVGGGLFAHWSPLPLEMAWEVFGERNGATTFEEMKARLFRYRTGPPDREIGCILLEQPFFLAERDWIPAPRDWKAPTQRGKGYDATTGEGRRLWEQVVPWLGSGLAGPTPFEPLTVGETRSKRPVLVYPRLGQGTFRVLVTDIYARRCVVTGERTLPVLQAAHIKPVAAGGPHDPRNGLLLRSDLHTLFDRGYITVTPDLKLKVGDRIREKFENGRDYYALDRRQISIPRNPACAPLRDYLDWHASQVFRG